MWSVHEEITINDTKPEVPRMPSVEGNRNRAGAVVLTTA